MMYYVFFVRKYREFFEKIEEVAHPSESESLELISFAKSVSSNDPTSDDIAVICSSLESTIDSIVATPATMTSALEVVDILFTQSSSGSNVAQIENTLRTVEKKCLDLVSSDQSLSYKGAAFELNPGRT